MACLVTQQCKRRPLWHDSVVWTAPWRHRPLSIAFHLQFCTKASRVAQVSHFPSRAPPLPGVTGLKMCGANGILGAMQAQGQWGVQAVPIV